MRLLLKGGRIIDPSVALDMEGDLLIEEGQIRAIDREIPADEGLEVIDCRQKVILPGLIDIHVHLREPGEEYKETIETGTLAAVAGGFTAVCTMPNTKPPNDCAAVTKFIRDRAREQGHCRVYPVAAITVGQRGKRLTEFADLKEAGAVALSDDGHPVADAFLMRLALEYSRNFNLPIISHAEELALSAGGQMNEGALSTLLGLKGIPKAAEEVAIFRDISLAALTGAPIHIAHVSTKGACEIIRRAKEAGVPVTAETAPHYFSLTEEAVAGYNTLAKVNPPLRTEEDREAIIEALAEGVIDVIATDHAPHSVLEKEVEFAQAACGLIGLETALPLTLRLVRRGIINWLRMAELLSLNPARILSLPGGQLRPGSPADITVIDPELSWRVTPEGLKSRSKNSPFLGWEMKGAAILTLVRGRVAFKR
ncbi:dihydroorotase [Thermosulfuriphilus ammonigenes]|uniref:Dihydroorotase n=1 Tax=Thermosulfuriphilus ammonigenes TaxID=1936021 RepID=A0A6G7PW15_9BACT|nr:dihydroorotase [Thermosulfuriphilus ammonigenes]MBA2848189.1 dihydroorotase [Thermosulfuriphilus ammonigenes]QIJ71638.1 dihydroorotase [Thermosulfuriphilus ammonigenes]